MEVDSLFEIRNNLIGVSGYYDDVEADEDYTEEMEINNNYSNDGIYIYLIDDNKIILKKLWLIELEENILILLWKIN